MTKHEVAKAIAEDGYCIETGGHESIECDDCPASEGYNCKTGHSQNMGDPNGDFAQWFRDWLTANPE